MSNKSHIKKGFQGEKMNVVPREVLNMHTSHKFDRNLYLTDIGYFPKARNHYRKRPRGCSEFILIYCIEGYGTINIEGKDHRLSPHSFFIVNANTPHCYYADEKEPWSIYWVHFAGEFSVQFYNKFIELNDGAHINIPFERNRIAEFEYLIDLISIGISKDIFEYACMLLYKTIGSFLYYSLKSTSIMDNNNDKVIEEIKDYLKNNISEKITVSKIANEFHKSNSSIFSLFKKKTGYSIIHYFNLLKIQHACELINLTSMPIKEISYHLNFQDPLYFSRLFKKYMGVSPSEYRKNL